MVRLHVKHGEGEGEKEFLYDCQGSTRIEGILRVILQIANLQRKIEFLTLELEPSLAALYCDKKAIGLIRALSEAKAYASKVLHGKQLLYNVLRAQVQAVEKELNLNYQLLGLSDAQQLQQFVAGVKQLQVDSTHLWWAGKELMRDKQLCHYIGMNEKTKITVKLQSDV